MIVMPLSDNTMLLAYYYIYCVFLFICVYRVFLDIKLCKVNNDNKTVLVNSYTRDGYNITLTLPPMDCGGKFLRNRHRTTPFAPCARQTLTHYCNKRLVVLLQVYPLIAVVKTPFHPYIYIFNINKFYNNGS